MPSVALTQEKARRLTVRLRLTSATVELLDQLELILDPPSESEGSTLGWLRNSRSLGVWTLANSPAVM